MKTISALLFLFASTILAPAQQPHDVSSAIDAKGTRYVQRPNTNGGMPPWIAEMVYRPKPEYPYSERSKHNEGSGLFRVFIDLKTGGVTNIAIVRSTGFPKLDEAAVNAFQRWRWKPGKWKEVEIPVTFTMHWPRARASSAVDGATHY